MALASRPRMLLLDEPMAGMGPEESRRLIELLGQLRESVTILLVEHDMDAVFALADRITVLVYGRVIATGTPAEIRSNADVRKAFLAKGLATDERAPAGGRGYRDGIRRGTFRGKQLSRHLQAKKGRRQTSLSIYHSTSSRRSDAEVSASSPCCLARRLRPG